MHIIEPLNARPSGYSKFEFTKSRWWTTVIFKNIKNRHLCNRVTDFDQIYFENHHLIFHLIKLQK